MISPLLSQPLEIAQYGENFVNDIYKLFQDVF